MPAGIGAQCAKAWERAYLKAQKGEDKPIRLLRDFNDEGRGRDRCVLEVAGIIDPDFAARSQNAAVPYPILGMTFICRMPKRRCG